MANESEDRRYWTDIFPQSRWFDGEGYLPNPRPLAEIGFLPRGLGLVGWALGKKEIETKRAPTHA